MKTLSIPKIINFLILFIFSVLLFVLILQAVKIPKVLSFILGAILGGCLSYFLILAFEKLNAKNALSLVKAKRIKQCMLILNTLATDELLKLFLEVFNRLNISATIKDEHTLVFKKKIAVFLFSPKPLSANDIYFFSLKHKTKKILIFSPEFERGVTASIKQNVTLIDKKLIFAMLEKTDLLPDLTPPKKPALKSRLKNFFSVIFSKTKGAKFIFYGTVLFLFSFITFFPTYYIISSAIFIVYGLIALFFGKIETKKSLEDFLLEALEK